MFWSKLPKQKDALFAANWFLAKGIRLNPANVNGLNAKFE
jgi:hypothetical protein